MRLPRLNGCEAAQTIRADSLNKPTSILTMTLCAFAVDRAACLACTNDPIGKSLDAQRPWWLAKLACQRRGNQP